MENLLIRDNVLTEEELSKLQSVMLLDSTQNNTTIPWGISNMYGNIQEAMCEKKEAFFWTHTFHDRQRVESQYFNILFPLLDKINPLAIVRIRANCNTITDRIIEHGYHTDIPLGINCTTSIFYLNTNNGYTLFDKERVLPKENRAVFFNPNEPHQSSRCSDQNIRMNINFNYF